MIAFWLFIYCYGWLCLMFDLLYFTTEVAVRSVVWRYGCVDGLVCFGC